jgi:hypothetical protein
VMLFNPRSYGKVPIVVLNGVAGTVVYLKLNKPSSAHFWCDLKAPWFVFGFFNLFLRYRGWINVEELAPLAIDCLNENLSVRSRHGFY